MKKAVIIGAGPAGLTAAYELLKKTDIKPIILEKSGRIGGISTTVEYKGNRIDIGGHRFFSKQNKIMEFWLNLLPLSNNEEEEEIMMLRNRCSRILFQRKFYDYPVSLNKDTLMNLGIIRIMKIFFSYVKVKIFPIKKEESLEDFFINRFGRTLYEIFFKYYTEKVWGISCREIQPEWGSQRVKGLSISKTIIHFIKSKLNLLNKVGETETSLIESFYYPKYGPGQLWEKLAEEITKMGGEIKRNCQVNGISVKNNRITSISCIENDEKYNLEDFSYIFSSMPVKDFILSMNNVPENILSIVNGLVYRDFITVGLLLDNIKINDAKGNSIKDNWIYIQERDVKMGRIQIFNNWSPYLVKDKNKMWLGLEFFCNEGDDFWQKSDKQLISLGEQELIKLGFIDKESVADAVVIKMEKAYPAYFGTYDRFDEIKDYLNSIENLYPIGRNGMHRYNNMDHSMLTSMESVECIIKRKNKNIVWNINAEKEYHEEK